MGSSHEFGLVKSKVDAYLNEILLEDLTDLVNTGDHRDPDYVARDNIRSKLIGRLSEIVDIYRMESPSRFERSDVYQVDYVLEAKTLHAVVNELESSGTDPSPNLIARIKHAYAAPAPEGSSGSMARSCIVGLRSRLIQLRQQSEARAEAKRIERVQVISDWLKPYLEAYRDQVISGDEIADTTWEIATDLVRGGVLHPPVPPSQEPASAEQD